MQRCDWCQEIGNLVPVVNRDPMSSHEHDWVCPACADVEHFEHGDRLMGNPLGFIPVKRRKVVLTVHLNKRCA